MNATGLTDGVNMWGEGQGSRRKCSFVVEPLDTWDDVPEMTGWKGKRPGWWKSRVLFKIHEI